MINCRYFLDGILDANTEYAGVVLVVAQVVGTGRLLMGAALLAVSVVALAVSEIGIYRWKNDAMADPSPSSKGCVYKANTEYWESAKHNWIPIATTSLRHLGMGFLNVTGISAIVGVALLPFICCLTCCCRY